MTTLANIRTKVRRLTGRPSSNQLTDAQIDDYINTFYLYDMPLELRLIDLLTTFEFLTIPNVDEYDLKTLTITTANQTDTAVNFFSDFLPPVFMSGYRSFFSESRDQFFNTYPMLHQELDLTGDGTSGPYTITLPNIPALQNNFSIGTEDNTGAQVQVVDDPSTPTVGTWRIINDTTAVPGSINYVTGAGSITFSNPIPSGTNIKVTWVPYAAARPQGVLLFDYVLTLRPVPDAQYLVQMNAYTLPTIFLTANPNQNPQVKQWWQYIAYGAAKKVLEDAGDPESIAIIMPEFKHQENLVLRRTIVQQTPERTATIYSEMSQPYSSGFEWQSF